MQYLLLIYSDETSPTRNDEATSAAIIGGYRKFTKEITESGNNVGGNALQPTATATTVRLRDGKVLNTDGPFAETKEQLGGYYLIEAKDLDEATAIAARIPTAKYGCIEVRPVMVYE